MAIELKRQTIKKKEVATRGLSMVLVDQWVERLLPTLWVESSRW